MSITTTVADVVDGKHADGEAVSVEGRANEPEIREGDKDWSFLLISFATDHPFATAVRVTLPGDIDTYRATLAPTRYDGIERRPHVKVTAEVRRVRTEKVPTLTATEVLRLEVPS